MENEIKEKKTVKTQIGTSFTADFEDITWSFKMPEDFKVWSGEFAIIDRPVYNELLAALKEAKEVLLQLDHRHNGKCYNPTQNDCDCTLCTIDKVLNKAE